MEAALGEVLAHVRGETSLPCRTVGEPAVERTLADDRHRPRSLERDGDAPDSAFDGRFRRGPP